MLVARAAARLTRADHPSGAGVQVELADIVLRERQQGRRGDVVALVDEQRHKAHRDPHAELLGLVRVGRNHAQLRAADHEQAVAHVHQRGLVGHGVVGHLIGKVRPGARLGVVPVKPLAREAAVALGRRGRHHEQLAVPQGDARAGDPAGHVRDAAPGLGLGVVAPDVFIARGRVLPRAFRPAIDIGEDVDGPVERRHGAVLGIIVELGGQLDRLLEERHLVGRDVLGEQEARAHPARGAVGTRDRELEVAAHDAGRAARHDLRCRPTHDLGIGAGDADRAGLVAEARAAQDEGPLVLGELDRGDDGGAGIRRRRGELARVDHAVGGALTAELAVEGVHGALEHADELGGALGLAHLGVALDLLGGDHGEAGHAGRRHRGAAHVQVGHGLVAAGDEVDEDIAVGAARHRVHGHVEPDVGLAVLALEHGEARAVAEGREVRGRVQADLRPGLVRGRGNALHAAELHDGARAREAVDRGAHRAGRAVAALGADGDGEVGELGEPALVDRNLEGDVAEGAAARLKELLGGNLIDALVAEARGAGLDVADLDRGGILQGVAHNAEIGLDAAVLAIEGLENDLVLLVQRLREIDALGLRGGRGTRGGEDPRAGREDARARGAVVGEGRDAARHVRGRDNQRIRQIEHGLAGVGGGVEVDGLVAGGEDAHGPLAAERLNTEPDRALTDDAAP